MEALDHMLADLGHTDPPVEATLAVHRRLHAELGPAPTPEIMTLDDVATYLRLSTDDMAAVADHLPVFEVAGKPRVRRSRLDEWIRQQEYDFVRHRVASQFATDHAPQTKEHVA